MNVLHGMRFLHSRYSLRARRWFTALELERLYFGGGPRSRRGGRWRTLRNRWRQVEREVVRTLLLRGSVRAPAPRDAHVLPDTRPGQGVAYPYVWRVRTRLGHRFGHRCAVLVRGRMNSCLVEFEDGQRVVTSRFYVRRAP